MSTNPNPPLPVIGDMAWGTQLNTVLDDLQRRVSALEGTHPLPPDPNAMDYTYDATLGAPPPSQIGLVTMDALQSTCQTIWITIVDTDGNDRTVDLAAITTGTIVGLEQADDATKWHQYYASAPIEMDALHAVLYSPVQWNAGADIDDQAPILIHITQP
jgi:hypothetical protein